MTSPEARVVGDFTVGRVLVASPSALWKLTRDGAGLSRDALYRYFDGRSEGVAIEVASVRRFKRPKRIREYVSDGRAPQGFRYL
jgi:predicted transcriptional regulator